MDESFGRQRPLVSVVLPTFNEARTIESVLRSLLDQQTPDFDLEILAIDGQSNDGTRQIVAKIAEEDPRVRLLFNERQRTPYAFNIGLREARGEYVCIMGAHTAYRKDYISVCLNELISRGAVACGGRVITRPLNATLQARLTAWVVSHPFGSSRKSSRTLSEGFADVVNYPVMLRKALIEAGGYDETLFRNQDLDMNLRLGAKGYKLFCTWKTQCYYFPKGLLNYAFLNGFWNWISLRRNFGSFRVRHFVPCLFLLTLMFFLGLGLAGMFLPAPYRQLLPVPFAGVLGLHLFLGLLAGIHVAIREKSPGALWLPLAFLAFHLFYGLGTLLACVINAKPDSLPNVLVAARG